MNYLREVCERRGLAGIQQDVQQELTLDEMHTEAACPKQRKKRPGSPWLQTFTLSYGSWKTPAFSANRLHT
jgi:hypothetical protein